MPISLLRRIALSLLISITVIKQPHHQQVGEGLRVAMDPFLPHFTRADADADDKARDLAEQQAIAAKEAKLAAKVAAARAPYEALKQKYPSQKVCIRTIYQM